MRFVIGATSAVCKVALMFVLFVLSPSFALLPVLPLPLPSHQSRLENRSSCLSPFLVSFSLLLISVTF